jgi:hypothetical protein
MSVIVNVRNVSYRLSILIISMTHLHTKCYNALLVNVIKLRAKYRSLAATILLLYVLQNYILNRSCIFFEDVLPHEISGLFAEWH